MKIHSLMMPDPITITANASVSEAIELMKINSIRHLPVISQGKKLEGFLTLVDLKQGLIPSMLGDLTLRDLMIKDPITVSAEDDIEFAAQLIYKYKIGGMPVVKRRSAGGNNHGNGYPENVYRYDGNSLFYLPNRYCHR